ncbi:MAG: ABC transporter substrate-binding protein [Halolamina sp.]|uniref:ABC transporter substrate-binding protein n=1 Tax=Halolamina sp. TaxID=1940283 RepID=UPI002FC2936C
MTQEGQATKSRRRFLSFAGSAAAAALAGCAGGDDEGTPTDDSTDTPIPTASPTEKPTETPEQKTGGTLRVGFESELTGLDPHVTSSVVSWVVNYNMCEGLITFDEGAPADRLAEDWSVGDGGTSYTFQLKEGVMFHPPTSREMVAEDVVYSFERMNQEGAMGGDLAAVDSVEATGEYEVTFTLKQTFAPFFNFLGRVPWVVVPEEAVENQGGELGEFQQPVGTGPFQFGEHEQGNFLRMDGFEEYRAEDVPLLDSVEVRPIPDADSRVAALRGGDIDMARAVLGKDAQTIRDDDETKLSRQKATGWAQVHINCSEPPWDDPAVRRAVAHAVDRGSIVDAGVSGYGTAAWQPYSTESVWNYDLGDAKRRRDTEKAQQILDDAGNPLDGEALTIKANTRYTIMETTANLLVAQLAEAGIDAEVEILEWGTQLSDFLNANFGAMAFSVPFKIDPDRHYYGFIHPSTNQWNKYGEEQPDADRMYELVQQGRTETDQDARVEIYTEFQKLVNKNVPWISIARTDDLVGLRSNVNGNQPWLLPYTRYWTMSKGE